MSKRISPYFTLIVLVLVSTIILWLPYLLRLMNLNMLDLYKNYDGPLYIVPAKTFYLPSLIQKMHIDIQFRPEYFAAHLPLYPFFIRLGATVFGYLKSMVFVNLFFTAALACFFYYFLKKFKLSVSPLILTVVFLLLPRFLVIRSVGAPESLFMFLILVSLFFFEKENYLMAGIAGYLAAMTKTPGILLFIAYALVVIERMVRSHVIPSEAEGSLKKSDSSTPKLTARNDKSFKWQYIYLLLIPAGLLSVFLVYWRQYGDFFAYFHSGDNIHLFYPFAVFNFRAPWVGTAWLEEIIFYFFLYLMTVFNLKNIRYRSLFYFGLVFFVASTFVQHRDISRYVLPLWPLACIAFDKFFTSKKFLIVLLILLPAIYLYAWNFLLYNVMPIGEWQPFL